MRSAIRSASPSSWVVRTTHTPLSFSVGHHGAHGDAPLGVDARRRLVEERHLRPADQGQGEGEPLLLAAREVAPRRGGDGAQPDEVEQFVRRHGVGVVAGEEVEDAARARAWGRRRRAGA